MAFPIYQQLFIGMFCIIALVSSSVPAVLSQPGFPTCIERICADCENKCIKKGFKNGGLCIFDACCCTPY
ncbi:hypothetical protein Lal_00032770 [Lupinus albus]|nr:hypothetical protein Lal_00032770 [Lupinus albus]